MVEKIRQEATDRDRGIYIGRDHRAGCSGECSDEIFGGYPWFYKKHLIDNEGFPWALSENLRSNLIKPGILKENMMVTPKEIDLLVEKSAAVLSRALNIFLQPSLDISIIESLT